MEKTESYLYIRKSPDDKESIETSLGNQIELGKGICEKKNWKLIRIFEDKNVSGSDRNRKGFNELIDFLYERYSENKNLKIIVIVKDQNRFARDSAFFKDTLRNLEVRGIRVFSIIKNDFLSFDDLGDNIKAVVDEEKIHEGTRYANLLLEQKKEKALPPIPAPYGYFYGKDKNWIINKREAGIVRGIIQKYLERANLKDILNEFKIDKGRYYRVMKNAQKGIYNGFIVYERKFKDSNKNIIRIEEIKYKGIHEQIIDEKLFLKVQK